MFKHVDISVDVRSYSNIVKHNEDPARVLIFLICDFQKVDISIDVCKKWNDTPMERLKRSHFPVIFNEFEIMISEI